MRNYILSINEDNYDKKQTTRKYVLAFAVVFDLIALGLIFSAIVQPYIWILIVGLIILDNVARVLINNYPKKYNYGVVDGKFSVSEITPLKSNILVELDIDKINKIDKLDKEAINIENNDKNTIKIYNNSCVYDVYMIEFSDIRIIAPLDEYMYTSLKALSH